MSVANMPLVPKVSGGELNVVVIGRISTIHQDCNNIEASYRYVQDYLGRIYSGPITIKLLGEQASGMLTDRATIKEAEALVSSGIVDLVIAEDLSRIYRNPRYQYDFVQNAVDMSTRVICIGDNLDTADENWEVTMGAATLRHGLHIPDTRRRVRRTATHSFHRGGMVQKVRFGYRKLTSVEATSGDFAPKDLRICKRPECTPIIREMMDRVLNGKKYAAIADWLNTTGIEPGPYVESGRWTARLVVDLLQSSILSGQRIFRATICRPIFRTGRHKSSKNETPESEFYPELAHLSPNEHESVRREITRRAIAFAAKSSEVTKRLGVPRSRSLWPGQAATCAICGGLLYYAGNHLRCCNSLAGHNPRCWNHVQVPAHLARERVISWLIDHLDSDDALRNGMVETVWSLIERSSARPRERQRDLAREITGLEKQALNLTAAIAQGGQLQSLVQKLAAVERALEQARTVQQVGIRADAENPELPSKKYVQNNLGPTVLRLANSSFEFADLMRRICPRFVVQPVQALDTALTRPRAKFEICCVAFLNNKAREDHYAGEAENKEVVLDLFEPPDHIRAIAACLQLKAEHPCLSLRRVGVALNISYMTVKRAFDYARLMDQEGLSCCYRELQVPPRQASRWVL